MCVCVCVCVCVCNGEIRKLPSDANVEFHMERPCDGKEIIKDGTCG